MSIANMLVFEKMEEMMAKNAPQVLAYIGEAELPAYYFSFGGSVPSDRGYGLLLDKTCKLKKLVYYNLGCEDDFIMTIKLINYDKNTDIRTFSVNNQRLVLDLENYETNGMIGVEIMSTNEPDTVFSRHRIILYVQ